MADYKITLEQPAWLGAEQVSLGSGDPNVGDTPNPLWPIAGDQKRQEEILGKLKDRGNEKNGKRDVEIKDDSAFSKRYEKLRKLRRRALGANDPKKCYIVAMLSLQEK